MASFPYLYQLQNASFSSLSAQSFRVAVIDMDESGLSAPQVDTLQDQGKILYTYLSVGEAEDYRDYWSDGNWDQQRPSFVLGENPDWPGNYSVKFWDSQWQSMMFGRVAEAVALGYDGMYLDIIDAYEVAQVERAYSGPDIRQAMIDFVIALSQYAKSLNADFEVIPQNAVGLLALNENNPDVPNTAYLNAIDGVGVEDLWYDGNKAASWTSGDLELLQNAVNAGKFVLATSYPTQDAKQEAFVTNAINAGFVPFAADRDLTGVIDPINLTIEQRMAGHDISVPWGETPPQEEVPPPPPPEPVPAAPLARAEAYGATQDTPLVVGAAAGVLANDSDANGDTLAAILVAGPAHGSVVLASDGSFTYTPFAGFSGQDSFTYGVSDGSSNSATVGVTLNVAAAPDSTDDGSTIVGTSAADTLNGGEGDDSISGRGGNDSLGGRGGLDTIKGGAGNDLINGGAGGDVMTGGTGNDVYYIDDAGDLANENGGSGIDTVVSSITLDLSNTARGSVERLTLSGTGAINGTGNSLDNLVVGNAAANVLNGVAGNDTIRGGAGNDQIYGHVGNDTLTGGIGSDVFVFNTAPNATTNRDRITDFANVSGNNDVLWLENAVFTKLGAAGQMNGNFFKAGAAATDANDYIVYKQSTGALFYDSNANAAGGTIQIATLTNRPTLTAYDFQVI